MSGSRSMKLELSQAEAKAKTKLYEYFSHEGWFSRRPSRQSHVSVLNLLKEFPILMTIRFQVRYPNNNRMIRSSPLLLLVEGQAELDIIKSVYELNPTVLSKDFDLIYILRRACQYRAPASVVQYLGLKFPKALGDSHYQQIALSYALRHTPGKGRSSFETIEVLLRLCPKSVHYVNNVQEHGDNALGLAIMNGYDLKVVHTILDVMERQSCDLTFFSVPQRWNFTMDSQAAKSIDLVLSRSLARAGVRRLKSFECRPTEWTKEGFLELMQYLAAKKDSITSLQLHLPNDMAELTEDRIRHGLRNLCDGPSVLEELELYVEQTPPSLIEAALHGLDLEEQGHSNQRLRKLVLHGASDLELRALCTFLASETAPQTTHIVSCRIHGRTRTCPVSSNNKIERLEVRDCFTSSDGLASLLDLITVLPQLKELSLVAPTDFSEDTLVSDPELPVEPLVDLMRNNKIQSLRIVAYQLDGDVFYDSFLENDSLQKFRYTNKKGYAAQNVKRKFRRHNDLLALALQYGNVTLVDPYIGDIISESAPLSVKQLSPQYSSKMNYYATLNSYGRSRARNPTESLATVVQLLCDVVDPYACFPCLDPLRKHNLQYGLLRESLSIWSLIDMPSGNNIGSPRHHRKRPLDNADVDRYM